MRDRVPEAVKRQAAEMEALDAEMAAPETAPPPEAPEPPAEPPPAPTPAADDWQHKFQTLQGKYNAEVPQLRGQVADLQRKIEELSAAPAATPTPPPAAAPPPVTKLITDEDTETYGDDLIDLIRRVAVETDAGEKAKLQGEIADLRKQMAAQASTVETVAGNVTGERRAKYFTDLVKEVPTYEAVDNDQAFKDWLLQADEFSGLLRNDILQDAYFNFDVARTAKVFNAYIAQATPAPTPTPVPEPVVDPQAELASQVSPGQGRAAAVIPPDDGKKVWTVVEMDAFYKDVARGDYRGRKDEVARIEADIDKALAEGRVR
jgi:hypothetical protein